MKKITFLVFVFASVVSTAQQELPNLRFDSNRYFYYREPGNKTNSLRYSLTFTVPVIQVFTSNQNNSNNRVRSNGNASIAPGRPFSALASPLLYNVVVQGNTTTYHFGRNGGENNSDEAEVKVMRIGAVESPSRAGAFINPPFKFRMAAGDVFTESSNQQPDNKSVVKINASSSQTATIEISRQEEMGNVFVCIFDSHGRILASLNPKSPDNNSSNLSFTVSSTVYVLPVIGPKVSSAGGTDTVVYEVGDPKEVATMVVEEE